MAPTSKTDLTNSDAMYLFEIMRDSPHPFLLHIGPYAEKTGKKANSIIKRLGDIKKRHGLNINTTTNAPGDTKSYTSAKPRPTGARSGGDATTKAASAKREGKAQVPKTTGSTGNGDGMKQEETNAPTSPKLPTPAPSPAAYNSSPIVSQPTANTSNSAWPSIRVPNNNTPISQMPSYLPQTAHTPGSTISKPIAPTDKSGWPNIRVPPKNPPLPQIPSYVPQKRTLNDFHADQYGADQRSPIKKLKTETWSF